MYPLNTSNLKVTLSAVCMASKRTSSIQEETLAAGRIHKKNILPCYVSVERSSCFLRRMRDLWIGASPARCTKKSKTSQPSRRLPLEIWVLKPEDLHDVLDIASKKRQEAVRSCANRRLVPHMAGVTDLVARAKCEKIGRLVYSCEKRKPSWFLSAALQALLNNFPGTACQVNDLEEWEQPPHKKICGDKNCTPQCYLIFFFRSDIRRYFVCL
ncbi:hypothetical protein DL96DRAFT_654249 [Flagelloscypha sp. PMI_526]|nr:hypothetical protein DL96DRAFT_654249 [Flagelloscypha sp. PMI_526]